MHRVVVIALLAAACGGGKVRERGTCEIDEHCTDPDLPFCNGGACAACATNATCTIEAPRCTSEGKVCGKCVGDVDCEGYPDATRCDPSGACVECVDASQCGDDAPVCGPDHACGPCASDDDCASAVCEPSTGACVATDQVAYATPGGAASGACTIDAACALGYALNSARPYLKLAAGTYDEDANLTDKRVSMHAGGATLVRQLSANGTADVTIEGGDYQNVIQIAGTTARVSMAHAKAFAFFVIPGTLVVRDSTIETIGRQSVYARDEATTASHVTLARVRVVGGDGFCVQGTSTLAIDTSVVVGVSSLLPCNDATSTSGPITIDASTLVNTPVACGTMGNTDVRFASSIIAGPDGAPIASGTRCSFAYSLVSPAGTTTGDHVITNLAPQFVNPPTGDFHLTSSSPAIDTGDPAAAPTLDFDGRARPIGSAIDLGAYEYAPPN